MSDPDQIQIKFTTQNKIAINLIDNCILMSTMLNFESNLQIFISSILIILTFAFIVIPIAIIIAILIQ